MLLKKIFNLYKRQRQKHLFYASISSIQVKSNPDVKLDIKEEKIPDIFKNPDFFEVKNLFTVKDLFDARVHYGHKIFSVNPHMKTYLLGSRLNYLIFDLNKTAHLLRQALNFTAHIAYQKGVILFISKNPSVTLLVENTAIECKEYAVTRNWKTGTFTNSEKIFKNLVRLPDLCIFLNTLLENGNQHEGIVEAAKMCIPSIGIVDSNCDPRLITYPVPGNDDSLPSLYLYLDLFKQAIIKGKKKRETVNKHT